MASDFIKWTDSLSVSNSTIDEQHKSLIKILNNLYVAFMEKKHIESLKEIVGELSKYTIYHFNTEEKMFKEKSYKLSEEHIKEHQGFIKTIEDFAEELERNPGSLTYKMMTFLKKWICEHILGTDKKYVGLI